MLGKRAKPDPYNQKIQTQELCVFGGVLRLFSVVFFCHEDGKITARETQRSCGTSVLRSVPYLTSHGLEKPDLN